MKSGDLLAGKYRLNEQLGAGAMGAVWSAVNERTGRKVAVKLLVKPSPEHRERMLREAQACGKLDHRNIVAMLDTGETAEGDPFLVMELLRGKTLGDLLKEKRRLEPAVAARIARDIASALSVAHAAKIVHRDLKPANIFLHRQDGMAEDEFVVKVVDFGVAKNIGLDGPATMTHGAVGSPAYMSPEQVAHSKDLDQRTDIWSLGIVLYEMLAGVRPFQGSVQDVVRQILIAPITPVTSRVRSVPPDLDELVMRCLDRDKGKRIHSAADLARMLEPYAEVSKAARVQVSAPPAATSGPARTPTWTGPESAPGSAGVRPGSGSVPEMAAVRAPMGSVPEMAAVRTPMGSVPEMAAVRPSMGSIPEAVEDGDLAATLPMQPRQALAMMQQRRSAPGEAVPGSIATPASAAAMGATGTQVLAPNQPVASPLPDWKREMMQARAQRQSSSSNPAVVIPEEAVQGGTMALSPEQVAQVTAGAAAVTTTAAAAMVQPASGVGGAGVQGGAASRKRRGSGWIVATVGIGVAAVAALAVVLVVSLSGAGDEGKRAAGPAASTEAAPGPKGTVAPDVTVAGTGTAAVAPTSAPKATAGEVAPPAPTSTASASGAGTSAAPKASATPPPATTGFHPVYPPCGGTRWTNCTPAKAPVRDNPSGTTKASKGAKPRMF
jgi:serine/threonine-protein kinase